MASGSIDNAFVSTGLIGNAHEPTYGGALSFMRRRYSKKINGAEAIVWGVPFDAAVTNRPGARFGPQAIRRASAIMDNDPQYPFHREFFDTLAVVDYGDCLLDTHHHERTPRAIERQASKLLRSGAFLLTLGGDHFITWPLLKAHAAIHGPLALVQFDAHQDTWSSDGMSHGSFVTHAVEQGIIDPDRSIQIGIRTHAPEEFGIKILYGYDVEEMRASDIAYAITERTGGRKTYVTFDIDCLDPAFAPGTGTPVAGGPSSSKMLSVLRQMNRIDIVGADVVEVAPAYDHADITAIAASAVAQAYLGLLVEKKVRNGGS
jgi:agmatinase